MTKSKALANLADCHDMTDMDIVSNAIHVCLLIGVSEPVIKSTLRQSYIAFSRLSASIQVQLNGSRGQ